MTEAREMMMYNSDTEKVYDFYNDNYQKFGYSVKSLAWIKGKQNIRFNALTKSFDLNSHFSILDIGCGFGDINKFFELKGIKDYTYLGIDLVGGMIDTAREIYKGRENILFECGDFINLFSEGKLAKFDYIVASGIFNFQMNGIGNYKNVENILKCSFDICNPFGGISFDFQSDKVDYYADNGVSFYNSPEKILSIFYKYSRNVSLNNQYMPFEFAVTMFKDDSFDNSKLVFNRFINENKDDFDRGIFYEE